MRERWSVALAGMLAVSIRIDYVFSGPVIAIIEREKDGSAQLFNAHHTWLRRNSVTKSSDTSKS